MNKNILYGIVIIIAVVLIIYGSFLLLSPAYSDAMTRNPTIKPKRQKIFDRIGDYFLEPGKGISYNESGQRFDANAPGQDPVIKGYYSKQTEQRPDPQGEADLFSMFGT